MKYGAKNLSEENTDNSKPLDLTQQNPIPDFSAPTNDISHSTTFSVLTDDVETDGIEEDNPSLPTNDLVLLPTQSVPDFMNEMLSTLFAGPCSHRIEIDLTDEPDDTEVLQPKSPQETTTIQHKKHLKGKEKIFDYKVTKEDRDEGISLHFKKQLSKGTLIEEVNLLDNRFTYLANEHWRNSVEKIQLGFYELYLASEMMQAQFEEPNRKNSELILKTNHDFKNAEDVLEALMSYAKWEIEKKQNLNSSKRAGGKKNYFAKKLIAGKLIQSVDLQGNELLLIVEEKYNHESILKRIRNYLYRLRHSSKAFNTVCESIYLKNQEFKIILKNDHGYTNNEQILTSIIAWALEVEQRKKTNSKKIGSAADQSEVQELTSESQDCNPIRGGIIGKYLPDYVSAKLPFSFSNNEKNIQYLSSIALKPLTSIGTRRRRIQRKKHSLKNSCFKADFYTYQSMPSSEDKMTFICAGRKGNALVAAPHQTRCVVVLTVEEYQELERELPFEIDVLVIKKLSSNTHGEFKDLYCINCRRLAILHAAHYLNLASFIMMDDNISRIKFNSAVDEHKNGWDQLYNFMEQQLRETACVSVRTESPREIKPGELGSKIFLINMSKIKKALPDSDNIFLLLPPADKTFYWGEDYYMQIMLFMLFPDNGYQIIESEKMCLNRSRKNANLAKEKGTTVEYFMDLPHLQNRQHLEYMANTYLTINRVIEVNLSANDKRLKRIENSDLLKLHAVANFQALGKSITIGEMDSTENFILKFKSKIQELNKDDGFFRYYQQEAIKSIGQITTNAARLLLATGSGKTVIQCRLAQIAYHTLANTEVVLIVTPTRSLVNQFYLDLIKFNRQKSSFEQNLSVPDSVIVKLSSDYDSLHVKTYLVNKKIKNQKAIIICCVKSFNIITKNTDILDRAPLILCDEYQEYFQTMQNLKDTIEPEDDTLIIGCTATPYEDDYLKTAYSYSRLEAVNDGAIAPVMADNIGVPYSDKNLSKFIVALPTILKKQSHPGFSDKDTLSELKGVIYLPSVEKCKLAEIELQKSGINCYCIHSKNPNHKQELRQFLTNDLPGVVLAVRMLRIGYDDKNLAWVMIAQKTRANDFAKKCMIEQMIGRVMRKNNDKIGYVLGFKDTYQHFLLPLTQNQIIKFPISMDYLGSSNAYQVIGENCSVYDTNDLNCPSKFLFKICPSKAFTSNFEVDAIEVPSSEITDKSTKAFISEEDLISEVIERPILHYYQTSVLNDNFTDFHDLYERLVSGESVMKKHSN